MKALSEPSPSDWERWEQRLADGEEPSQAAKAEGQTCSAFKRQDAVRQKAALLMGQDARALFVDDKVEAWALADDADVPVRLAWMKRWNQAYRERSQVEMSGPEGGPVQVEDRSASLAEIAAVLRASGALTE